MNAKISKIELVNGSMLTFTFRLPKGKFIEDFGIETAIGGVLNSITERGCGIVNSYLSETNLKVGDEITESGEVIEGGCVSEIEQTTMSREGIDYRDALEAKRHI